MGRDTDAVSMDLQVPLLAVRVPRNYEYSNSPAAVDTISYPCTLILAMRPDGMHRDESKSRDGAGTGGSTSNAAAFCWQRTRDERYHHTGL